MKCAHKKKKFGKNKEGKIKEAILKEKQRGKTRLHTTEKSNTQKYIPQTKSNMPQKMVKEDKEDRMS